jgi:hypothetical protein
MKFSLDLLPCLFLLNISSIHSQVHQINKFEPDPINTGFVFGVSVAVDGNYAIVGCPYENYVGNSSGAVYIYKYNPTLLKYEFQAKIIGSNTDAGDSFGSAVSINGDLAVVGAPQYGTYWNGAVYIFKRIEDNWVQDTMFTSTTSNEQFGTAVAITDRQLIAGSKLKSAYYFVRTISGNWDQKMKITTSDPYAVNFGRSVCLSHNYAVIGDNENTELGWREGAVFVYKIESDTIIFIQKILPEYGEVEDMFGLSLALNENYLVVASHRHRDFDTTAINRVGAIYIYKLNTVVELDTLLFQVNSSNLSYFGQSVDIFNNFIVVGAHQSSHTGEAFLFKNENGNWIQLPDTIKSEDGLSGDNFGSVVSISDDHILIGAPGHNKTGLNAHGAAYVFENRYVTSIEEKQSDIIANDFFLSQNYPNPFNPITIIRYNIPSVGTQRAVSVQMKIYDVLGNEIAALVNEEKEAGSYELEFNAEWLTSGVYFYQLKAGSFIETKKMILLR